MSYSLYQVRALDAADPLASFRPLFRLPEGVIYLDGNSLGPTPASVHARLADTIDREWGQGLIRSWNGADWMGAPARIGAKIAPLIGAAAHEVTVADSTSVNLFKLLSAGLAMRPDRRVILTETGNFPTDLYMAGGLAVLAPDVTVRAVARERLLEHLDGDVAVLMLTHVHYKTGARHDMPALTAAAHAQGALALWDLSHSTGAIRIDLAGANADLAVGCGYKFLNGGPGAPAFLYVAERLQAQARSPLTGWMGHAAPFAFSDDYAAAPGVTRFLCGTPPVLGLAALEEGVNIAASAPMDAIEAKSAALWAVFDTQMRTRCAGLGFARLGPENPAERGSHISFTHPEGYRISEALRDRGVIGDFRDPDVLRFGLTPLYLGYEDVWRGAEIIREIMDGEHWRRYAPPVPGAAT